MCCATTTACPDPEALRRAVLFARSGSALLTALVREKLMGTWLAAAGMRAEDLDEAQRIDVDIIFGGIVAAMGDPLIQPDATFIAQTMARPLGRAMVTTLSGFASKQAEPKEGEWFPGK